uniref:ankyrin repeat domain-containing protein n=1 Tax=Wolbachia endosymbiont of Pentidionis agamae TaxID=3110435 RepID=UPI002FD4E026
MREINKQLFEAIQDNDSTLMNTLIKEGANVNAKDENGLTPLHQAARGGHTAVVEILLKNIDDVNATNRWNYTPLYVAKGLETKKL